MRKLLLTFLFLLLATSASAEIIRPTGAYDPATRWANEANAYDDSLTTYSDMNSNNDGSLYVGATVAVGTDAWDTPSGTYSDATIYCVYESAVDMNNSDTFEVHIVNSADVIQATLLSATSATTGKVTSSWSLSATYLSDPTDLRCRAHYDRVGGHDPSDLRVYEVWIDGTVAGLRNRIFNLGKNEEVQDEKIYPSSVDGAVLRRVSYGRADPNDQHRPTDH